jgi:8-oxo-dGTP pyrophosphatase MutT (NUDIX family)
MNYVTAVHELTGALSGPLAARAALALMSPRTQNGEPLRGGNPPPAARSAAGLVLIFPDATQNAMFVLTERSPHLPAHPGQIGLPAGMQASGESLERTARREAEEEIGIEGDRVVMLGALSAVFIPPSNIVLHPFVGHLDAPPRFTPLPREVTRIFEVPLSVLLDPESIRTETRTLPMGEAVVPYFKFGEEKIWGATAIVLGEIRALLLPS